MRSVSGNFMSGLLIGLIAGSVIALLTAPKSGNETRQMIGERAQMVRDKATEAVTNVADKASDRVNRIEEKGKKFVEEQKERMRRAEPSQQ